MTITAEHDLGWWRERALMVEEECARRDGVVQGLRFRLQREVAEAEGLRAEISRLEGVVKVYRVIRAGELSRRKRWLAKIEYWRKRARRLVGDK